MGYWQSPKGPVRLFVAICAYIMVAITAASQKPVAISVPVRADWLGYDGFWSPVSIRVGTPPQWIDVFASTANQETWVIGPGGCDGTQQCLNERGGIFQSNTSSTWDSQGFYPLGLDPQLGLEDNGVYGLDSIALSDTISVPGQIIGIVNTTDYWLGYLGLGAKPTNLTAEYKSFLDSMVENQSLIPSHSYGFTAGAHYRLKSVPASLTLGGFDADRFESNNMSFELDPNQNPVIAINQIVVNAAPLSTSNSTTGWQGNSNTLLGPAQADLFTIDSSTPFLWLPESVCLQFEKVLGLKYDDSLQLYTFAKNAGQHENLVGWNLTFVLTLADLPGSPNSMSLTLPYAAFDLQLSYPYPGLNITQYDPAVDYFPLRKATNSTQYTIGRAFLQETYLTVDYERNNFSISQAKFSIDPLNANNMNLIDIIRPSNSTWSGPSVNPGSPLDNTKITAIAVGTFVAVSVLVGLLLWYHRTRRHHSNGGYVKEKGEESSQPRRYSNHRFMRWLLGLPKPEMPAEIDGSNRFAHEVPSDRGMTGLPGKEYNSELEGSNSGIRGYYGSEVEKSKANENAVIAIGHDTANPVELPYQSIAREPLVVEPPVPRISFSRPGPDACGLDNRSLAGVDSQASAVVSSPSNTQDSKRSSGDSLRTFVVSPVTAHDDSSEFSSIPFAARRAAWYAETPSISSESHDGSSRSRQGTISIEEKAGFSGNSNLVRTVSPIEETDVVCGKAKLNSRRNPHNTPVAGPPRVHNRAPRNSAMTYQESIKSESFRSPDSTVTNEIRRSIQRGFSWAGSDLPVGSTRPASEQAPFSHARWVEFWRTGKDPRLDTINKAPSSDGS